MVPLAFLHSVHYMCLDTCNEWLYNVAHGMKLLFISLLVSGTINKNSEKFNGNLMVPDTRITRGKEDEGIL